MNSQSSPSTAAHISLPSHGVDWRFLLPLREHTRMLVIHPSDADYDRSFQEFGIPFETVSFDNFNTDRSPLQFESGSFDIVAAPLGFGGDNRAGRQSQLGKNLLAVRSLIRAGGMFLLGFSNRWDIRRKGREFPNSSTTWRISRSLERAGFDGMRFYGTFPEPLTPEYIFPLNSQSLAFVLNYRYQHKLPGYFLKLTRTPAVNMLLGFVPFYYAVASVEA
ncbi:MAG TPA: hypothetical protein PKE35_11595 [Anaerolineales bacterium]|nr:hypothetical protein [Anaerolineales bacterium]HMX19001.1 hypothetical protein [Anaerolineales bacterium]HMX74891.1 hypothetical protein [Anaerolineales bacterium]HMZ41532.1 hypothetical protein [Anaerolineales bacterium]HNA53371.1 hypothetical protein [Anaerolineales bacterium]